MPIRKYLAGYAEPETRQLDDFPKQFDAALVLPVFDERWADCEQLIRHQFTASTLIVLVLNQPEEANDCENNRHFHNSLLAVFKKAWQSDNQQIALLELGRSAVLLVDRYTTKRQIPQSQGVGLARKIGADIALCLIDSGKVRRPWIYNTDADVSLPDRYIELCDELGEQYAAVLLPFEHCSSGSAAMDQAQQLYDIKLQYYVDALRWAGSPYAYHSLGSTQIIGASHYAKVRGFPKRNAGEDFHLLSKLAKSGEILSLQQPSIKIMTRISQRTPFGTGTAIKDILASSNSVQAMRFYHPEIFRELKSTLSTFEIIGESQTNSLSTIAERALDQLGFGKALTHAISHSSDQSTLVTHLHTWFDALKTLQFIHALRDSAYPNVTLQALDDLAPDGLQVSHQLQANIRQQLT